MYFHEDCVSISMLYHMDILPTFDHRYTFIFIMFHHVDMLVMLDHMNLYLSATWRIHVTLYLNYMSL